MSSKAKTWFFGVVIAMAIYLYFFLTIYGRVQAQTGGH